MNKSTKFVKKTVALVTGGYSAERGISLKSAKFVEDALDRDRLNVFVIYLDQNRWYHRDSDIEVDRSDFTLTLESNKIVFDFVFLMIHGDPAENGLIQGYFKGLNIAVSTCDTFVSALTFNKYMCNKILANFGVLSARSKLIRRADDWQNQHIQQLGFPLFVKPNNNGSSYGISKVNEAGGLESAIRHGFDFDDELIVEEFIQGREFTCGAIQLQGEIHTFPITEIVSFNEYFDYQAKYENESNEITPANLSLALTEICQDITRRIYKTLNCRGIIRADFILKDKTFYVIEVNTIPGMTEQSLVPQQVEAYGWTAKAFFKKMIDELA